MVRYKVTLWGKVLIFILTGLLLLLLILAFQPKIPVMSGYKKAKLADGTFNIYFAPNSADIPAKQYPVLDKAISDVKANATMFLYVTGNSSKQEDGHELALARAQAVTEYCMMNSIPGFQIFVMENGSLNPKGKSPNRVELYLKE